MRTPLDDVRGARVGGAAPAVLLDDAPPAAPLDDVPISRVTLGCCGPAHDFLMPSSSQSGLEAMMASRLKS